MLRNWQIQCAKCQRVCAKDHPEQKMCIPCNKSEALRIQGLDRSVPGARTICKFCHQQFNTVCGSVGGRAYCSPSCHDAGFRCHKPDATLQKADARKKMNEKWKSGEKKNQGNRISLKEAIRRNEYSRVFDEKGWSRYNKGRKWDCI